MLILTRSNNESLVIGDEITITVLGIKSNQVRLGIKAPKDISVLREEIYDGDNSVGRANEKDIRHSNRGSGFMRKHSKTIRTEMG